MWDVHLKRGAGNQGETSMTEHFIAYDAQSVAGWQGWCEDENGRVTAFLDTEGKRVPVSDINSWDESVNDERSKPS